ncbi:hypothetical protein J9303_00860 [Bacillaceae bacterium Marseille-Q3522]|nr:hypothetical protein [Bacillaceae bacterium Marseille-Q3522]
MFTINIKETKIQYSGNDISSVYIQYNVDDPNKTVSLNGYETLTAAEYAGNETPELQVEAVRTKLINKLQNTEQIQIQTVALRYQNGAISSAEPRFTGVDPERKVMLNGNYQLTAAEYAGNEAPSALEGIIKTKLIEDLQVAGA